MGFSGTPYPWSKAAVTTSRAVVYRKYFIVLLLSQLTLTLVVNETRSCEHLEETKDTTKRLFPKKILIMSTNHGKKSPVVNISACDRKICEKQVEELGLAKRKKEDSGPSPPPTPSTPLNLHRSESAPNLSSDSLQNPTS